MGAYTGRPGIDWGGIATAVGTELKLQEWQDEQQAQAIRWQGAQDYQTLIDSGVDPAEAMRRSASKLFYNDPRALATVARGFDSQYDMEEPVVKEENGRMFYQTKNGWKPLSPENYGSQTFKSADGLTSTRVPLTEPVAPKTSTEIENEKKRKPLLEAIKSAENAIQEGNTRPGFEADQWLGFINWGSPYSKQRNQNIKAYLEAGGSPNDVPATAYQDYLKTLGPQAAQAPVAPIPIGPDEVVRVAPDGRRVVYNRKTLQPIRYAD